jgi:hypothetical protein
MAMMILRTIAMLTNFARSIIAALKATKPNKKYNRPRKEDDEKVVG